MTHGTAPKLDVDQFAEFAAAVTRQLPRDISKERAQEFIQYQDRLAKLLRGAFLIRM